MSRYRDHFDHLGRMTTGDFHPWTKADKVIFSIFVLTVLLLGVV